MRETMEISHVEVRRHPIWKGEVRHESQVAGPTGAISPGGRLILATAFGIIAVATLIVLGA